MSVDPQYACDSEFVKLLSRRNDVDLTIAALEIARDAQPELDFQPTLDWIAARGTELRGPVTRAASDVEALDLLARCLAGTYGIIGRTEAYDHAESSFLNRVIETGCGIPISLSLLYAAVGKQVGLDLKPVAAPMHFLTCYESVEGTLYVDAFSRGRILTKPQCLRWLGQMTGQPRSLLRSTLEEVSPRAVVIRMLNNLKALYLRQQNWSAAWPVQHRLAALQPADYRERRDFAVISMNANRPGHAIELFESCMRTCPTDEKPQLKRQLAEAYSRQSLLN